MRCTPFPYVAVPIALALMIPSCKRGDDDDAKETASESTSALEDEGTEGDGAPDADSSITWIEDDYDAAIAAARERETPLVVVLWAAWCPTCKTMKSEILPDPALQALADRFVWAKIDTDRPENAEVVEKLSIEVWPTSYVLSPDGSVQARLTSSASVEQFREFLLEGEKGHIDAALEAGELGEDDPLLHGRRGDRALAENDYEEAKEAYAQALEKAPEDWSRTPDVLVSYMHATMQLKDGEACAELAREHMGDTGTSRSAVRFARYTIWCGEGQTREDAERELIELADERLAELLEGEHKLSAEDQNTALGARRELYETRGDEERARELAHRQRELLDEAAERAHSPLAKSSYSSPRAEVYSYLGDPEALIPELIELAKALPDEYDPAYRVAQLSHRTGDLDTAETWASRALERAYGPPKGRVFELLAEIQRDAGNREGEREVLEELVAHLDSLPSSQAQPETKQEAEERIEELSS